MVVVAFEAEVLAFWSAINCARSEANRPELATGVGSYGSMLVIVAAAMGWFGCVGDC